MIKFGWLRVIFFSAVLLSGCSNLKQTDEGKDILHQFTLVGGYFYGPGPVVPDTLLPTGYLREIIFDIKTFKGYAKFYNDGSKESLLSDGKTRKNQNIEAGVLEIGGGENTVLLVAVKGGPNNGTERYFLGDDYTFNWQVDLALDPGFPEGIVRVDEFNLTTGVIQIANSEQTDLGLPNGYDQAGTLKSGDYLAGRVGDYNNDGYLDGVVVAAPRVPIVSQMLPGSPVGNKRGFETDIKIPAHLAGELTLRSILQLERPVIKLIESGDKAQLSNMLQDIQERISSSQLNMDIALVSGDWSDKTIKANASIITDRIESAKTLSLIGINLVDEYPNHGGKFPAAALDSVQKMFNQLHKVTYMVSEKNKKTSIFLPKKRQKLRV